jgi:uncharacterized protein DUF5681
MPLKSENSGKKQDTRFKPGQSGNPAGKPKGTRNATTRAVEALLEGEAEELTRKAIELAKEGDLTALRLCLDRIVPPRKDRHVAFGLLTMNGPTDAVSGLAAIVAGKGDLTPSEASELTKIIESYTHILETADHEERLRALEGKLNANES